MYLVYCRVIQDHGGQTTCMQLYTVLHTHYHHPFATTHTPNRVHISCCDLGVQGALPSSCTARKRQDEAANISFPVPLSYIATLIQSMIQISLKVIQGSVQMCLVLARPPLTLVPRPFLDHMLVDIPLVPRLIPTLRRCAPDTDRVNVTLGLSSSTTVRMVGGVHSETSDRRSDVEPPASSGFTQLSEVIVRVTRDTDRRTRIWCDSAHFAALQTHRHVAHLVAELLFGDDHRECACTAAEDRSLACRASDIVHLRAQRNHVDRKTVAAKGSLCCQHTGIQDSSHALQ